jgi:hypothetical protein
MDAFTEKIAEIYTSSNIDLMKKFEDLYEQKGDAIYPLPIEERQKIKEEWVKEVSPEIFTNEQQASSKTSTKNHRKEIHAHLRADRNLPKEAADLLIKMVELAYESLGNKKIR